jgi:ATP-dependent Clp protease ATP-binding subunit ClpC
VLRELGVTVEKVGADIESFVGRGDRLILGQVGYTPRVKKALRLTGVEGRELGHEVVGTGHLLLGMLREGEGVAVGILVDLGVDLEQLRATLVRRFGVEPVERW